jgi:hypothetical protein
MNRLTGRLASTLLVRADRWMNEWIVGWLATCLPFADCNALPCVAPNQTKPNQTKQTATQRDAPTRRRAPGLASWARSSRSSSCQTPRGCPWTSSTAWWGPLLRRGPRPCRFAPPLAGLHSPARPIASRRWPLPPRRPTVGHAAQANASRPAGPAQPAPSRPARPNPLPPRPPP